MRNAKAMKKPQEHGRNAENILIVGGGSGLGFHIGELLLKRGASIHVTGRSARPLPKNFQFIEFDITHEPSQLAKDLDRIMLRLPRVDVLVYAAGFFEKGRLSELSDDHIVQTIHVGVVAPAMLLKRLLRKQGTLPGFIAITSTSQWIPRELEPTYTASKAGLAMLAQSASLDERVKKTLVVGPAGMDTPFWKGTGRDITGLLAPQWVAEQLIKLWEDSYAYRLARILRDPPRVEILETR